MTHALSILLAATFAFVVGYGGPALIFSVIVPRIWPALDQPEQSEFAARVERELRNPDPDVRAALREVDHIGWAAPPVALPEFVPPTLIAGDRAVRVAGETRAQADRLNAIAAEQMRALQNSSPPSAAQQMLAANCASLSAYAQGLRAAEPLAVEAWISDSMDPPPRSVIDSRPWYWPYITAKLDDGTCILHERFGSGRVPMEWLELHRHDIVQAVRKGNFEC